MYRSSIIPLRKILAVVAFCVLATATTAVSASAQQRFLSGSQAIEALGANLPAVAAKHGMSPAELRAEFMRSDRLGYGSRTFGGLFLGEDAQLIAIDEFRGMRQNDMPHVDLAPDSLLSPESAFQLHSRPQAERRVLLFFEESSQSGTCGARHSRCSDYTSVFARQVWQHLSQVFAPFELDVTTHTYEPPSGYSHYHIPRPTSADMFVIIELDGSGTSNRIFGKAVLNSFGEEGRNPPLIHLETTAGPDHTALAVAHMIGHTLGLRDEVAPGPYGELIHDPGHTTTEGVWAPIMGDPMHADIAHFGMGEYLGAVKRRNSFAIMQRNGLTLRADDYGMLRSAGILPTPVALGVVSGTVTGVIERPGDRDTFYVNAEPGLITASATSPGGGSTTPHLALYLLNDAGAVLASSDPAGSAGASLSFNVTQRGAYYLMVSAKAVGDAANGIPALGNRGAYSLTASFHRSSQPTPSPYVTASQAQNYNVFDETAVVGVPVNFQFWARLHGATDVSLATIHFGDGTTSEMSMIRPVQKVYDKPGTYTVSVRIYDKNKFVGIVQRRLVIVGGRAGG